MSQRISTLKFFSYRKYLKIKALVKSLGFDESKCLTYAELKVRQKSLNDKNFKSEVLMENTLRALGVNGYRKNYPLFNLFFGDFVFVKKKLVIEIDGSCHRGREDYDAWRDRLIAKAGWKVFRFKSNSSGLNLEEDLNLLFLNKEKSHTN